jgi:hypothetical protein
MVEPDHIRGTGSVMHHLLRYRLLGIEANPMRCVRRPDWMLTMYKVTESWPLALIKVLLLPARGHGAQCSGTIQRTQRAPVGVPQRSP